MSQDKANKAKIFRDVEYSKLKEINKMALLAEKDQSKRDILEVQFQDIDDIKQEFAKQHNILMNIVFQDKDEVTLAITELHTFQKLYAETCAMFNKLCSAQNIRSSRQSMSNNPLNIVNPQHINLPKLEIIKFNGDIKNFPAFYDLFENLIHLNITLSPIEKFSYLISYLEGPPLSMVKCLPLSAANYTIAYESLVKRYNNKRLLAQAYWSSIENAQAINCNDPHSLRHLLDTFSKNLEALKTLNLDPDAWDFILSHMLLKKLDSETVTRFEVTQGQAGAIPSYKSIFNFLENQCNALFTVNPCSIKLNPKNKFSKVNDRPMQNNSYKSHHSTALTAPPEQSTEPPNAHDPYRCLFCNNNHLIYKCSSFNAKTSEDRFQWAKSRSLCINCLSSLHRTVKCQSSISCKHCQKRHHTLLHFNKPYSSSEVNAAGVNVPNAQRLLNQNTSNEVLSAVANNGSILATVNLLILDNRGCYQPIRALLDTGSQVSFITQKRANQLNLPRKRFTSDIQGIGQTSVNSQLGKVDINIRPRDMTDPILKGSALVLPHICSELPSAPIFYNNYNHIKNLKLADPYWHEPAPIELLLGVDLLPYILQDGKIVGKPHEPTAFNTIFGYVIMGQYNNPVKTYTSFLCQVNYTDINNSLRKLWELENVPNKEILSPEDELCEKKFLNSVQRNSEGRYIVPLPFRDSEPTFPGSRDIAYKRLLSLERRLLKSSSLYKNYSVFLQEYLDLNHMERLANPDVTDRSFYIPHHSVEKPDSLSTQLRVVFNASAKIGNHVSLNETLLKGPKLQKDISSIILNFRLHNVVLTADISKMYRQILISPDHQDYQRILFRFNVDEPVSEYRLKTITYGTTSAPFMALRVLQHLAETEKINFPLASDCILNDTYIDDICTGCDSVESARSLRDDLIKLLRRGGFELHKWASNYPSVVNDLPETVVNPISMCLNFDNVTKILGLRWQPQSDHFTFVIEPMTNTCTKRHILSALAQVFDPLGYLTPITLLAKSLISKLWLLGLDWDTITPPEITSIWNRFKSELPLLNEFKLHRHINIFSGQAICDVCGFADASIRGYAAVAYLRVTQDNNICIYFLCAKSRVAPLKTISIPKLELCAAVLLAELTDFVLQTYKNRLSINRVYAWSDSTVALSWIKSHPSRWKVFVSNRVSSIQEKIAPANWYYIPTLLNPADVASRGVFPSELLHHKLFYNGPEFLQLPEDLWPHTAYSQTSEVLEEERKVDAFISVSDASNHIFDILLNKCSRLATLQRIVAYVFRFISSLRNKIKKQPASPPCNAQPLTYSELHNALLQVTKHVQSKVFADEIRKLKNNQLLSKSLKKLNLFLDSQNILRVGGRLHFSSLSYDKKYPILLPKSHRLTHMVIDNLHNKYLHAGAQSILHLLNQNFWLVSAKKVIYSVISKCVRCFKVKPQALTPFMGNLPTPRVSQLKCFSHSGIDLAGPYNITMGKVRGAKTLKAYIGLFVCMATKAIHIELISDLTADAFVAALRRFVARRGRCSDLYSDNATNFISANKQLLQIDTTQPIQWHFIPPQSPNFGGLWEAGVKSVKTHLVRVIGAQLLTYEELLTVLCQIEAILNSRPLTPLSSDPNDLLVLTPGHFLTLEPLSSVPDASLADLKLNRLSRWQLLQRLHQDFWSRWHLEYLHTLQQRGKWLDPTVAPAVDTLVLIKDDLSPPLQWRLGRIMSLHPGADGIARVATVKTTNGILKRPLSKLCPLPNNSEPQDA